MYPIFGGTGSTFQSLGQFGFDKSNVAFGQVGLGAFLQKIPIDIVFDNHPVSKIFAGHHRVSIAVNGGHVTSELDKFLNGLLPVFGLLGFAGVDKQSVGDVFHGQQKTCATSVVPPPGFVKLCVVHKVNAGSQNSDGLKSFGSD